MKNYNRDYEVDNAAQKQWDKSDISMRNYKSYILEKTSNGNRYPITLIDLLYVSNFKGGNGTINDHEEDVRFKLSRYSEEFIKIESQFGAKKLSEISDDQITLLCEYIRSVFDLTKTYHIDGFGESRLSALLHSYFPELIPIIDRRVLNGLGFLSEENYNVITGQVRNIGIHYNFKFLKEIANKSKGEKSIREVDRELFIIKMFDKH